MHVLMESLGAYNEELADKGLEYTWNIVQIRLNACGVTKAQEWEKSKWAKSDHATPAGKVCNFEFGFISSKLHFFAVNCELLFVFKSHSFIIMIIITIKSFSFEVWL